MIPADKVEEIREKAVLSEFISEYTTLKPSGSQYMGICPFHDEKSPSFSVSDDKGLYYCFGCGEKGTIFDFISAKKALSFPEAVKYVASRVGVQIVEEQSSGYSRSRLLRTVNNQVAEYFEKMLQSSPVAAHARAYLSSRQVSEEEQKRSRLGFAPNTTNFLVSKVTPKLSKKIGISEEEVNSALFDLGLLRKDKKSDFFRDRLLFPISRSDGAVIAFGGRILADNIKAPKYLNTKESLIYKKRRSFYGLECALSVAIKRKELFVVEGYFDVLGMRAAGFENAVATCGTALTGEHVDLIKRIKGGDVVLVFDGDTAGRQAALRSQECFINSGLQVFVCLLPRGEDPHSLQLSGQLPKILANNKQELFDFCLEEKLRGSGNKKTEVANFFAGICGKIKNPVEKELAIVKLSTRLGVSKNSVEKLLGGEKIKKDFSAVPRTPNNTEQISVNYELTAFKQVNPVFFGQIAGDLRLSPCDDKEYLGYLVNKFSSLSPEQLEARIKDLVSGLQKRAELARLRGTVGGASPDQVQQKLDKIREIAGIDRT